jgi:hypothetical protein
MIWYLALKLNRKLNRDLNRIAPIRITTPSLPTEHRQPLCSQKAVKLRAERV